MIDGETVGDSLGDQFKAEVETNGGAIGILVSKKRDLVGLKIFGTAQPLTPEEAIFLGNGLIEEANKLLEGK